MERTCPTCNQQLPEVETLEYRFCPHCGAEITAEPRLLDEAYLTIPPDLTPPQADGSPGDVNSEAGKKKAANAPLDDHTIAPQSVTPQNRPEIKPPAEPPPATFFRTPPPEPDHSPPTAKKKQATKTGPLPSKPPKKTLPNSRHTIIIAILICLALVILILGGLFTF
jgi:hypothetical protein